jgi:hypothetical protein
MLVQSSLHIYKMLKLMSLSLNALKEKNDKSLVNVWHSKKWLYYCEKLVE